MRTFVPIFFAGIMCMTTPSCERKQVTMVICFIDLSSRDSGIIQWYKETFKKHVLPNMPPSSRLVVLPIDYASHTGGKELFMVNFSKNIYGSEYAGLQAADIEKQQHLDSVSSAIKQFDPLFDAEWIDRLHFPEGTDVFGALKQCGKYVSPGQRTIVVLLSDMLQFTDRQAMNFESKLNSVEEIEPLLEKSEKVDLRGIEIVVLTGLHRTMQPEKYQVIQGFWERYLAECNGRLIDYSSGAVSKLHQVLAEEEN